MNINFLKFSLLFVLVLSLGACQVEEMEQMSAETITVSNYTAIDKEYFEGDWKLSVLESEPGLDLNGDGTASIDLMQETSCFDASGVVFYKDSTFATTNARLDFKAGENDDKFECRRNSTKTAKWSVDGDHLVFTFTIDDKNYNINKEVTVEENSFSFEVTKVESDEYDFISNAEGTVAENVEVVKVTYTRI